MSSKSPFPRHRRPYEERPTHNTAVPGRYFVTLATVNRNNLFISRAAVDALANSWVGLKQHYKGLAMGSFVVMPNHVHGILTIQPGGARHARGADQAAATAAAKVKGRAIAKIGLPQILGVFKAETARAVNTMRTTLDEPVWSEIIEDHVITDNRELKALEQYIAMNPEKWEIDELFVAAV